RRSLPRPPAHLATRRPPRAGLRPQQLPPPRRGSGRRRADLEGRSLLQRPAVLRLEGAGALTGAVAPAAHLSAAHRAAPTHLAARKGLAEIPPAHLDARSARPLIRPSLHAVPRGSSLAAVPPARRRPASLPCP